MLIKGFNKDLKCRGFQFEVGGIYEVEGAPKLCSNGFHYCDNVANVHNFYELEICYSSSRHCRNTNMLVFLV